MKVSRPLQVLFSVVSLALAVTPTHAHQSGEVSTPDSSEISAAMTRDEHRNLYSTIYRALVPCERQPLPAAEAAAIKVNVRVTLNSNGGLEAAEVVRVLNDDPKLAVYEPRMRALALAIIRRCTPIVGLPAQLYAVPGGWRQFTYRFDPRHRQ